MLERKDQSFIIAIFVVSYVHRAPFLNAKVVIQIRNVPRPRLKSASVIVQPKIIEFAELSAFPLR